MHIVYCILCNVYCIFYTVYICSQMQILVDGYILCNVYCILYIVYKCSQMQTSLNGCKLYIVYRIQMQFSTFGKCLNKLFIQGLSSQRSYNYKQRCNRISYTPHTFKLYDTYILCIIYICKVEKKRHKFAKFSANFFISILV